MFRKKVVRVPSRVIGRDFGIEFRVPFEFEPVKSRFHERERPSNRPVVMGKIVHVVFFHVNFPSVRFHAVPIYASVFRMPYPEPVKDFANRHGVDREHLFPFVRIQEFPSLQ